MKLNFCLALIAFVLAPAAFAAKLQPIAKLQNPQLADMALAANADQSLLGNFVQITVPTPANGRTSIAVDAAMIEQAAHQLCGFFDDGVKVSLVPNTKAGADSAVDYLFGQGDNAGAGAKMKPALEAALSDDLEIFAGDASGNNTSGTVLGVYDRTHNEIVVYSSTNCGSDN